MKLAAWIEHEKAMRAGLAAIEKEIRQLRSLTVAQTQAENEILKARIAELERALSIFHEPEKVALFLEKIGWRSPLDAQWAKLTAWCNSFAALLSSAPSEYVPVPRETAIEIRAFLASRRSTLTPGEEQLLDRLLASLAPLVEEGEDDR